jgi:hypothetical protein
MCHIHHDPDAIIQAYTEAVTKRVIDQIMALHGEDLMPAVIRLNRDGLVFQHLINEDIHSASKAGMSIIREMNSLGFVDIKFYDHCIAGQRTSMEYTLTTIENFEVILNV